LRQALDLLYRVSGGLAAAFLVAICAIVLVQVALNLIDKLVALIGGEPPGLLIPSYAEFAGFFLAASSFLALAYTLREGSHIRVSLLIQHIEGPRRRAIELWCLLVCALLTGYFTFYLGRLILESLEFGDVSPGMVPVPLWIPQSAMELGLVVLTVALVDEFCRVLRGRAPSYQGKGEALLAGGSGKTAASGAAAADQV
jgi:TRAP-type C4-dicarboxylate transport system permease small subunit